MSEKSKNSEEPQPISGPARPWITSSHPRVQRSNRRLLNLMKYREQQEKLKKKTESGSKTSQPTKTQPE